MNKKKKILVWISILIWMLLIFGFSNMNKEDSNNKSKEIIDYLVDKTIETSNKVGVIDKVPTEDEQISIVEKLNKPLRKCMHFTVYLILAFLILNALNQSKIKHRYLITLIICFIYAITDEYHQTFINGRNGQFLDVIIDILGSITYILIHRIYNKHHNKKYKI